MSTWQYVSAPRDDGVRIPRFWLTLALSLLLHGLLLWLIVPRLPLLKSGDKAGGETETPLSVKLATRPSTPPPPAPPPTPAATQPAPQSPPPRVLTQPRRVTPQPRPTSPPVIAIQPPEPVAPVMPPPAPPAPELPKPSLPVEGDLAAYIASRRAARGESPQATEPSAAEREKARRDALVAANMGSLRTDSFGQAPKNGGGTFQIRNMNFDDAEFTFYGWSGDIGRRAFQVIEVRRGSNPDINTAIVRRIIAIIREHEKEEFRWSSKRLGQDLTLSARPADNAELERFMMDEFFTSSHQPR